MRRYLLYGGLYAHFHCEQFGCSDIKQYCDTMERLERIIDPDVKVYCSHNDFIVNQSKLGEAAALLRTITQAQDGRRGQVNKGHQYLEVGKKLEECMGDGFSVVYTREESHYR